MIAHKSQNDLTEVFLNRKIKIIKCSDISKIGISGLIINDTKNMFYILSKNDVKKIPKKDCVFEIFINDKKIIIDGKDVCYNIAERIKKYS